MRAFYRISSLGFELCDLSLGRVFDNSVIIIIIDLSPLDGRVTHRISVSVYLLPFSVTRSLATAHVSRYPRTVPFELRIVVARQLVYLRH